MDSALPFAQQLHAIAPPEAGPVVIVLLHPSLPAEVVASISLLGPTYYVQVRATHAHAVQLHMHAVQCVLRCSQLTGAMHHTSARKHTRM